MSGRSFLGLLLLLLAASPAVAASEEGGGVMAFVWEAGNLLLLLGILVYLGRKPVLNYLSERRQRIQDNLANSEQLLKDAEARLAEWNERAAGLDEEVEELRRLASERAEQEKAQILEDARAAAERIKRDAASGVDRELERAKQELRDEAADLAVELAGKLLQDQVTDADRDRLVDEFVSEIEAGSKSPAPGGSQGGLH
jgi:F-type H+-transporting ATPase subunit b